MAGDRLEQKTDGVFYKGLNLETEVAYKFKLLHNFSSWLWFGVTVLGQLLQISLGALSPSLNAVLKWDQPFGKEVSYTLIRHSTKLHIDNTFKFLENIT